MPFDCDDNPATVARNMKDKSCQSIIVLQGLEHFVFDVYINYIEWDIARIIWIAFYKNDKNEKCLISQLPKDLVKFVLGLLGRVVSRSNTNDRAYIKI